LPEFDRKVLEVLREPLETGEITISRAARQADFPANFQLIAAMNPCPCGWLGHPSGKCHCTGEAVLRYQDRISGPLLDRIDMQLEISAMAPETMSALADGEATETIAARVVHAYSLQVARQGKANQYLTTREIDRHCRLDAAGDRILRSSMAMMHWSARAYHRVLKVARTIADLAGSPRIQASHVSEAVQYRRGLRER
jgi:magnesium chelatase family protein